MSVFAERSSVQYGFFDKASKYGFEDEEALKSHLAGLLCSDFTDHLYIWVQRTEGCFLWAAVGTDRPVLTDPCRILSTQMGYGNTYWWPQEHDLNPSGVFLALLVRLQISLQISPVSPLPFLESLI